MIDPRAPRFGAWITTVVLGVVLLLSDASEAAAAALLALQVAVFVLGTQGRSPYVALWKRSAQARTPAPELEDARPVRFAQVVGLAFTSVALLVLLVGAVGAAQVLVGMALVAALLNAAVGLCLGCELYLLYKRSVSPSKGATA